MAKHRVLVTDKLAEEGLAQLRAEPDIEVVVNTKLAQDTAGLRQALQDADGIAIRSGTQLTAEILEGQSRLKAIVRAGAHGLVLAGRPGDNVSERNRTREPVAGSLGE